MPAAATAARRDQQTGVHSGRRYHCLS
jgi:hypothetical protein